MSHSPARDLVETRGTFRDAVGAALRIRRILWNLSFEDPGPANGQKMLRFRRVEKRRVLEELEALEPEKRPNQGFLDDVLIQLESCDQYNRHVGLVNLDALHPIRFVQTLFGGLRADADLKYFVTSELRRQHNVELSHRVARAFHVLAKAIDALPPLIARVSPGGGPIKVGAGSSFILDVSHVAPSDDLDLRTSQLEVCVDRQGSKPVFRTTGTELEIKLPPDLPEGRHNLKCSWVENGGALTRDLSDIPIEVTPPQGPEFPRWRYIEDLRPALLETPGLDQSDGRLETMVDLFLECCELVGYIRPSFPHFRMVEKHAPRLDPEFLLSNLFGLPTSIRGFDELFGGGGIRLPDALVTSPYALGGRTILIEGEYGAGKSILALQLAVEVARKGGIAWLMLLEQSARECLYMLSTLPGGDRYVLGVEAAETLHPADDAFIVADDVGSVSRVLNPPPGMRRSDRGALLLLGSSKTSFTDFLDILRTNAERMREHDLRLVIVDPFTSIIENSPKRGTRARAELGEMLEQTKKACTNVLLIADGWGSSSAGVHFAETVADTVIHLRVQKRYGYAQRYIEVRKSRLQREQRGDYPFSIAPAIGARILPTAASVASRTKQRGHLLTHPPTEFGLTALDDILGPKALAQGDLIVIAGPPGTLKTQLGILFLLAGEPRESHSRPSHSLLLSASDDSAIKRILDEEFVAKHRSDLRDREKKVKTPGAIHVRGGLYGFVQPGTVFQILEDDFNAAWKEAHRIDRALLDGMEHWDASCPFIRDDATFPDSLVDYLRRQRVTTVITCGSNPEDSASPAQRAFMERADCVLRLTRSHASRYQRIEVVRTRTMAHQDGHFPIYFDRNLKLVIEGARVHDVTTEQARVFINGKSSRLRLSLPAEATEDQARAALMAAPKIAGRLEGHAVKSVRWVPERGVLNVELEMISKSGTS